ncbi:hypothetical protein KIN20_002991, partial [Parelaphostrongylus tenuis]
MTKEHLLERIALQKREVTKSVGAPEQLPRTQVKEDQHLIAERDEAEKQKEM